MSAKYVRPYSKGQRNDFRDAEAMKSVATKTEKRSPSRSLDGDGK